MTIVERIALPTIRLISVNVAQPAVIGKRRGKDVRSGIQKRPVASDYLMLSEVNLDGDGQADLRVHGGPEKAVYAYPSEHLPIWNAELSVDPAFGPGTFGENLTTAGLTEDDARIGDIWSWGTALLQVAQPRLPCFKLAMVTGRTDMLKRMTANGRSGWYLRVLTPGRVPVAGPIEIVERHPAGVTVRDIYRAMRPDTTREELERTANLEPLEMGWRTDFREALSAFDKEHATVRL